jgi:hypothetical protein
MPNQQSEGAIKNQKLQITAFGLSSTSKVAAQTLLFSSDAVKLVTPPGEV